MKNQNNPNIFGEINLKITLNILAVSFGVSLLITTAHNRVEEEQKKTLTFAVTTFATTAAGLGAFYAHKSLVQGQKYKLIDKTHSLIERWNDPEFIPFKVTAKKLVEKAKKEPLEQQDNWLVKYCNENIEEEIQIIAILNFLTEIALCIEEDFVDEGLLQKYFKTIVKDYCEDFHGLINHRRGNNHNQLRYKALIELKNKWIGTGK